MYFGKKQQLDWTFILILSDVTACLVALPASIFILASAFPFHRALPPWPSGLIYLILVFGFLKYLHLYSWPSFRHPLAASARLTLALALTVFAFTSLLKVFGQPWEETPFLWLGLLFLITLPLLLIGRILTYILLAKIFRVIQIERVSFVGGSIRLDRVLKSLSWEMGEFHQMVGYFSEIPHPQPEYSAYQWLGSVAEIDTILEAKNATLLIVEENSVSRSEMAKIADACGRAMVSLKIIPSVFDFWSTRLSFRTIAGIPLMGVFDLRHDRLHNRLGKRMVDILGALVGLTLFAPVIAILGVLVYLESPGPIFFRQRRVGLGGESFSIIKIRSMRMDAESGSGQVWAVQDDPRRLKIGKFMRSKNLDELPQFWNVLKGQMSLVGPRPEMYDLVQGFQHSIHNYNLRHTLRPGVTGWAAVHGLRGNTSLEDRIEYDLFYIEHWSFTLDFTILFMTILPPKNAY